MTHEAIDGVTHRSDTYYIASAVVNCDCGNHAKVVALALPSSHELLDVGADDCQRSGWVRASKPAFLFGVTAVSESVRRQVLKVSGTYRRGASDEATWLNHCLHCGEAFTDDFLHCEPDGAFCFTSASGAAQVALVKIEERLEVTAGGYTMDPEYFGACAQR